MLGMMRDVHPFQVWTLDAAVAPSGAVKRKQGCCKDTTAFRFDFAICLSSGKIYITVPCQDLHSGAVYLAILIWQCWDGTSFVANVLFRDRI